MRIPAYCNGVVGLRTGFGRVPTFNPNAQQGMPLRATLMATQGPITRSVRDARLALEAMARGDRRDWRWSEVPMCGPPPARPIKVSIVTDVPGGPTHPAQTAAAEPDGKREVLTLLRTTLLASLLGLPGLAVPVGSHGKLRTGVQITAMRNREDLCLDAGEVIEGAEGVVMPIDPAGT